MPTHDVVFFRSLFPSHPIFDCYYYSCCNSYTQQHHQTNMDYRNSLGAGGCNDSPPIITIKDTSSPPKTLFGPEKDDISLYGTPKEEKNNPILAEAKASFMRNQIEALFQPSDNKLAMKLFGSKKALMNERLRQKESGHWIIHPCSNFRFVHQDCHLFPSLSSFRTTLLLTPRVDQHRC